MVVFHKDGDREIAINLGHAFSARVEKGWLKVCWKDGGESLFSGELAAKLWTRLTMGAVDVRTGQTLWQGVPFPRESVGRNGVDPGAAEGATIAPERPRIETDPAPSQSMGMEPEITLENIEQFRHRSRVAEQEEREAFKRRLRAGYGCEVAWLSRDNYLAFADGMVLLKDVAGLHRTGGQVVVHFKDAARPVLRFFPLPVDQSSERSTL